MIHVPPVLTRPKLARCILHIGSTKTGTSSIQRCLKANADALLAKGILYPSNTDRGAHHTYFASAFLADPTKFNNNIKLGLDTKELAEARDRDSMLEMLAEINGFEGDTLILSTEYLSHYGAESAAAMSAWLSGIAERVEVVCYVRHPLGHATSAAQQRLRVGHATIEEVERDGIFFRPSKTLPHYIAAFGREAMRIRPFEREQLTGGNVILDFLETCGIGADGFANLDRKESNSALSYEAALIADALNRSMPRTVNGTWNPERAKQVTLAEITGSKFGLSKSTVRRIKGKAKADLRYMQKEFGIRYADPSKSLRLNPKPVWDETALQGLAHQFNSIALKFQHAKAEVAYLKSQAAEREENSAEAIRFAREALDLHPEALAYLRYLCRLLVAAGRPEKARAQINRFLKLRPDHPNALRLLKKLESEKA